MWSNYFLQIRNKYTMRVSTKEPLVINLDGKDVTKDSNINITDKRKGGFFQAFDETAKYFSNKYNCLAFFGADEISFIFQDPMVLINDINSDGNNYTTEIASVFSQMFYDLFNNIYTGYKVYWHTKCFSIKKEKVVSFIKYKSKLFEVLKTTYFLKRRGINNPGVINLEEKYKLCRKYEDFANELDDIKGTLYLSGTKIDLNEYIKGNIVERTNNSYDDLDEVEIDFSEIIL